MRPLFIKCWISPRRLLRFLPTSPLSFASFCTRCLHDLPLFAFLHHRPTLLFYRSRIFCLIASYHTLMGSYGFTFRMYNQCVLVFVSSKISMSIVNEIMLLNWKGTLRLSLTIRTYLILLRFLGYLFSGTVKEYQNSLFLFQFLQKNTHRR